MPNAVMPADPERALTLAYAPAAARAPLATLWRLDERLGQIVATTRDPRIGEIRLAWWREALEKLDAAPPPDEPMLREAAAQLLPRGLAGSALGGLADGWTALLVEPLDEEALEAHAGERGGRLFALAARLLGEDIRGVEPAGEGWALVDAAFHLRDSGAATRALALARVKLAEVQGRRWPVPLRPLGALAALAAGDAGRGLVTPRRPGSPARVARVLLHRITGR